MSRDRKVSPGKSRGNRPPGAKSDTTPGSLRIIGGYLRGRRLLYSGDRRTRPMKDRVREAMFNLIGPAIRGTHAIDLFAGTGAVALEAISRGAARATLIEQHFPTARRIQDNVHAFGLDQVVTLVSADVFRWAERLPTLGETPWAVFCSPPYRFYEERSEEMMRLIEVLSNRAPQTSLVVVEGDHRFNPGTLPHAGSWSVRHYAPAVLAIYRSAKRAD